VTEEDLTLPAALAEVNAGEFDYDKGIDFEPFPEFLSAAETADWIRAWTGNPGLDGAGFRVFGQDGTGGYAAFWLVRPGAPLPEQPVVFLGSEGERAVVARDLDGYLWLLAGGVGPYEATAYGACLGTADERLTAIAQRYAPGARRPAAEVIAAAQAEFPDFDALVGSWCR